MGPLYKTATAGREARRARCRPVRQETHHTAPACRKRQPRRFFKFEPPHGLFCTVFTSFMHAWSACGAFASSALSRSGKTPPMKGTAMPSRRTNRPSNSSFCNNLVKTVHPDASVTHNSHRFAASPMLARAQARSSRGRHAHEFPDEPWRRDARDKDLAPCPPSPLIAEPVLAHSSWCGPRHDRPWSRCACRLRLASRQKRTRPAARPAGRAAGRAAGPPARRSGVP